MHDKTTLAKSLCIMQRLLCCLILTSLISTSHCQPALAQSADELFVRRIEPMLQEKCVACHGGNASEIAGGLDLRNRDGLDHGGDSGLPLISTDKTDDSPLLLAVQRTSEHWSPMPPKEADQLTMQQIAWLREWIVAGAPWPTPERVNQVRTDNQARWAAEDGVMVETSLGLTANWNQRRYAPDALWAYRPLRQTQVAATGSAAIDELIQRSIPAGMPVAPTATAAQFIRRATYDLTGLPTTEAETAQFVEAYARNADWAVEQLVDRLLASPHYGERMAQHWLDVVRYADSSGFSNDYERGNAWRYRDYVVRAFNSDKPYDCFVAEQIAGDEIDEKNPELLIATGFLRMGPWELTGMEVARVARQRFLDDVTNSVGETFLAHSLQCARCHDHKFDPIPTRDYYALQAVFASTQLVDRPAEFLAAENLAGFEEVKYLEQAQAEHQATLQRLDEKSLAAVDAWYADQKLDDKAWKAALKLAKEDRQPKRRGWFGAARAILLRDGVPEDQFPPRMLAWTPKEIGLERIANKGLERIAWQLERYQPIALSVTHGPTPEVNAVTAPMRMAQVQKLKANVDQSHILLGGDPFSRGEQVKPGVLSVLDSLASTKTVQSSVHADQDRWSVSIPDTPVGRRLALAGWLTHRDNALTARTLVNRIWMWHFNQPLAGNPNNFGGTGKRPTHPELLDWLAAALVQNQWSIKSMHRLIMNSAAYRRSATLPRANLDNAELEREHLENAYAVFKPRRLTAEELRDSMLAATGELNRTLGGIPNRPEIHQEVALQPRQVMGTFAAAWVPNPLPSQRHRRSLYALKLRGLVDPQLEVFNAPTADFSCERRDVSTVPTQALALMNGQFSHQRAIALADRCVKLQVSDEATLAQLWQIVLGRAPTADELARGLEHWQAATRRDESATHSNKTSDSTSSAKSSAKSSATSSATSSARTTASLPLVIERAAVEENTGERFNYQETLYGAAEFVPDLAWSDTDSRTRGLAHLCLVLLNCNEFLYLY